MELTFSEYFDYVHHEPVVPTVRQGAEERRHPVVVVGGGPTGLAVALGLATYGVRSVVIEADDTVCSGSRAGAITRRTLEIFERLNVIEPVLAKGFAWSAGRTYYRDRQVYSFEMPHDENQKYPPGMSLQQNYVEQYLLDEVERRPDLIEVRWQSRVERVVPCDDGVELAIRTPVDTYTTFADRVVACDGGRSTVRRELGLEMHGTSYEGRYVIIDIRIDTDGFPIGRRCWFDPPSNPGATLLMYTKPDGMVRFDYQLRLDEDVDEAVRPENVLARVDKHLTMMGVDRPWEPVWMSLYRANALTLDEYVHDRVVFAGDAAHLVPIFGVRGMNSSLDDAHNLAWKLALVSRGLASDDLLRTYSEERVYAARENLRLASKSAEFMAPPSGPSMLMRDAVLSLSADHPWVTTLLDPRQHSAIPLVESPLNGGSAEATWASGPAPGDVLLECPVSVHDEQGQREGHLTDLLGPHFTVLCFSQDGSVPADVLSACPSLELGPAPQAVRVISRERPSNHGVHDSSGRLFPLYGMDDAGGVYLVRPDGHVLARWHGMPGLGDELAATIDKTLRGGALAREGAA